MAVRTAYTMAVSKELRSVVATVAHLVALKVHLMAEKMVDASGL